MRQHLHAQQVLKPAREGRSVAVDLPATVFSQDAVLTTGAPP